MAQKDVSDIKAAQRRVLQYSLAGAVVIAAVALLSTATDRNALLTIFKMALRDQGYCAQIAVEGLRRIGSKEALTLALSYAVDRSWDDTLLGGFKAY